MWRDSRCGRARNHQLIYSCGGRHAPWQQKQRHTKIAEWNCVNKERLMDLTTLSRHGLRLKIRVSRWQIMTGWNLVQVLSHQRKDKPLKSGRYRLPYFDLATLSERSPLLSLACILSVRSISLAWEGFSVSFLYMASMNFFHSYTSSRKCQTGRLVYFNPSKQLFLSPKWDSLNLWKDELINVHILHHERGMINM